MLEPFLRKRFQQYTLERRVYSIPIDVIAKKENEVVSIELKSRNHKRGIAQAQRNKVFSDFSYLSVWKDQVTCNLTERLKDTPIGLIGIDSDVDIIQKGKRLDPNPHAKNVVLDVFKDGL